MKPTTRTLLPLAGAALAYSLAQTMVIPALPELQARVPRRPRRRHLAADRLPAHLVDRDAAARPPGRHARQGALAADLAGHLRRRLAGRGPRRLAGRDDRRAGHPGRGRRDLPAGHRDHPRRVPARAGGAGHRHGVGDVRHRRRRRASCSPGCSSTTARSRGSSGSRWSTTALAALATWLWVPESPVRVRARIDWVGGVLLSLTLIALLLPHQRGQRVGLDLGRACSACSPRRPSSPSSGRAGSCGSSTRSSTSRSCASVRCGRRTSPPSPSASRCSGRSCSSPSSCRRRPSAGYGFGASVTESGLFLLPSALLMLFAGPAQRAPGRALRLARARWRSGRSSSGLSYAWLAALPRRAHRHLPRRASCSASGSGSRWRRWPTSSSRPSRPNVTGVASAINAIMRTIGGAIGAQVAAAIVSGALVRRRALPGRVGLHGRVRDERASASVVALLVLLRHPLARAPCARARGVTEADRGDARVSAPTTSSPPRSSAWRSS